MIGGPWALLALAAAWAWSAWTAYGLGVDHEIAAQARQNQAVVEAVDAAASSAAAAIARIQVHHETIVQHAETVIRERPVYRDCVHAAGVLDDINAARTGRAVATGGGELPASGASR